MIASVNLCSQWLFTTGLTRTLRYSFVHPRAIAHRALYRALVRLAPAAHGTLLDVGCGSRPYAALFAPYVTRHIGVDVPTSMHSNTAVDVMGTALRLPLQSGSCNTVLATEVMEHVSDPRGMLMEIRRVLAPGGVLILSVPLHEPLHELPYDYYRYTDVALRHLLTEQGFLIERIERRGGPIAVVTYLFCAFLYRAYGADGYPARMRMRPLAGPPVVALCAILQMIAAGLDPLILDDFDTLGFVVLARKA
ncbi:MAG: methyltransferase domain-containing protein [Oscillochloridaceae bacterium]|nr:methyltransferase domain-containing protein [Chloroflexaceae bacterium]MDW8389322.1 methyltransferase domain-containing protein [Oscillochloridaceae bacterium]